MKKQLVRLVLSIETIVYIGTCRNMMTLVDLREVAQVAAKK